jgi:hypothetical protein
MERALEVLGTSAIAAATAAVAMIQVGAGDVLIPVVSGGVAALVGYFSAQITVRSELASLQTEMRLLSAELHRYYHPARGESRRHDEDTE